MKIGNGKPNGQNHLKMQGSGGRGGGVVAALKQMWFKKGHIHSPYSREIFIKVGVGVRDSAKVGRFKVIVSSLT